MEVVEAVGVGGFYGELEDGGGGGCGDEDEGFEDLAVEALWCVSARSGGRKGEGEKGDLLGSLG